MEWVETTGRTVEEAKEAALDQLGVDEQDAEFEIVEEARFGLFGRLRSEARVRARVRPTKPRAKEERRGRRKSPGADGPASPGPASADESAPAPARGSSGGDGAAPSRVAASSPPDSPPGDESPANRRNRRGRGSGAAAANNRGGAGSARGARRPDEDRHENDDDTTSPGGGMDVALDEQAAVAKEFLDGLVERMSLEGEIAITEPEEDTVELNLSGQDLGLLIGPKGSTLLAIQDLTRTVVQRKTSAANGRILVDVAGYRRKRKEALARFTHQVADEVLASGTRRVLEPMSAADRKIVHDTVNDIDGVVTISEGEDPHRRVVILPIAADGADA